MLSAGLTLSQSWYPMDTGICPFGSSFETFLACQRFRDVSWCWSRCRRNTTGFIRLLMMRSRMSQCFMMFLRSLLNFGRVWGLLNHVIIGHQFRDSVTRASVILYSFTVDLWSSSCQYFLLLLKKHPQKVLWPHKWCVHLLHYVTADVGALTNKAYKGYTTQLRSFLELYSAGVHS